MSNTYLEPQIFPDQAVTLLPALDFLGIAKQNLPQIYQAAPNFMGIISATATIKQYLYDVIRSLTNIYNLYSSRSPNATDATPSGPYLRMLATNLDASFSDTDTDAEVITAIVRKTNFVVSRGQPKDFFSYFEQNSLAGNFNNVSVQESNNATIFFNVPVPNLPLMTPNPFDVFIASMQRLKASGVKISAVSSIDIPYFQLADLDENVGPDNAGFAGLNFYGRPVGGGHFKSV